MNEKETNNIKDSAYEEQTELLLLRAGMLRKAGSRLIKLYDRNSMSRTDKTLFEKFMENNPAEAVRIQEYKDFLNACEETEQIRNSPKITPLMRYNRKDGLEKDQLAAFSEKLSNNWQTRAVQLLKSDINQYVMEHFPNEGIIEQFKECRTDTNTGQGIFLIYTQKFLSLCLLKEAQATSSCVKIYDKNIDLLKPSDMIEMFRIMPLEDLKWIKMLEVEINGKKILIELEN